MTERLALRYGGFASLAVLMERAPFAAMLSQPLSRHALVYTQQGGRDSAFATAKCEGNA